jgi:Family of unknown function (DUF6183)
VQAQPGDSSATIDELIHRADLDALVRMVDSLCVARDWSQLLTLRDRARSAVLTGRQVWPVATLAEYRLALWAPAEWAARVLDEDSGRFSIGPLTEVIAQHHTFESLAALVPTGPRLGFVAHERVLRGERVDAAHLLDVLEIPYELQPWEPQYCLAEYSDSGIEAPSPELPPTSSYRPVIVRAGAGSAGAARLDDDTVTLAVRQLVEPWTSSSDGHAEVACVEGDADDAVAALGVPNARLAPLEPDQALAWLAWAGASGGAHGRRRGGALGRFGAWWLAAALSDVVDEWPIEPDELGRLVGTLRWWWWDAAEPRLGWELQLAIDDPVEGYAWAINARDAH